MIKKILSTTSLLISLLLFFYTFYRSEIYWDGNIREKYLYHYILTISLIFISLTFFILSKKIFNYITIFFLSTLVSIYSFETLLNYKKQKLQEKKHNLYFDKTGQKYDTRNIFEIYNDKKKTDKNIAVKVSPSNYINQKNLNIFPLSGISNVNTINNNNENGYYMIYKSDRYGFNNPDSEWDNKEIEFFIVGDSFVHGMAVNRPNDISSVLREISKKNVINVGYSGNGPLIEYASLKEYLYFNKNLRAKKILWIYFDNDIDGLTYELFSERLKNYLKDDEYSQNLLKKQNQIDELARSQIEIEKNKRFNKFKNFIKLYELRKFLFIPKNKNKVQLNIPKEFEKILIKTKQIAEKNNAELFFIHIPDPNIYIENLKQNSHEEIKKLVKGLNIDYIDIGLILSEKYKNLKKFYPFEMYGHYNVNGYRKVTEEIYRIVK
jgi:hypothetical protein